jgi:hypothetical protein
MVSVQVTFFVAELHQVLGLVAQEGDDHIAGDAHLVRVLLAEEATKAAREPGVGHWPDRGDGPPAARWREMTASTMLFRVDLEAPMAVKSQSMTERVSEDMGRSFAEVSRPMTQVRQVRQFRAALARVLRAEPRGAIISVNARLMASIVAGTEPERRARTGSKWPSAVSRGEACVSSWRVIHQWRQRARMVGVASSRAFSSVGMAPEDHRAEAAGPGPRARVTAPR